MFDIKEIHTLIKAIFALDWAYLLNLCFHINLMFGSIPICLNFRDSFRYEAGKCFDEVTVFCEILIILFQHKKNYHISYVIEDMEQINQRTFNLTCDIFLCDVLSFFSFYNSLFSSIAKRDSPLVGLTDAVYVCTSSGSLSVVSI